MDHLPPDDRRISSGAVAAAWAMVAGLIALVVVAAVLRPQGPTAAPPIAHVATHAQDCDEEADPQTTTHAQGRDEEAEPQTTRDE